MTYLPPVTLVMSVSSWLFTSAVVEEASMWLDERMLVLSVDHGSIFDSGFQILFWTTLGSAATSHADFQSSLFAAWPFLPNSARPCNTSNVHGYLMMRRCEVLLWLADVISL